MAALPLVLVVDDEPVNRELLEAYLERLDCEVITAVDGAQALALVEARPPDVVLLDAMMPRVDGFEVCRRLKADPATRLIPVVMVTSLNDVGDRVRALDAGADDFLAKPVDRVEVLARVTSLIRLKQLYDRLDGAEAVIFALASAVEARDAHTERHTERVAEWAARLGEAAGMSGEDLEDLHRAAMIHDIGKIGVPDAVLFKAGKLDDAEWEAMKRHPVIGEQIARPLRSTVGLTQVIRHHHEHFDGSGYPDGLTGAAIPLPARVVAICDAYDAMTNNRPYRDGMPLARAIEILREGAGTQWDPRLVDLFLNLLASAPAPATATVEPALAA
ncbi:MAG: cyclic di-GMP phosphodiesterase [Chloroflexota bacterium]|jgi:putative two-component system response regulator|nr:cyclic di-GMP phosphodiesterase [Chloroflexota bacterium]